MRQISRRPLLLVLLNVVFCGWYLPIAAETSSTDGGAFEPGRAESDEGLQGDSHEHQSIRQEIPTPVRVESPMNSPQAAALDSQHAARRRRHYGGRGEHNGGGFGGARGRPAGGRRPRQSEAATFFNSLDENSDGVLAKEEIREFVGDVGGSTLDDTSEIWGSVSKVMGRLDTDNEEGIGLKELSTWINNLGSILTVEEAADWVTHAVQLPEDVAEAFRSNSVSGYDFPELVENNGEGLHYDLGIKWNYRKRIVKAIEIRLLGLGDEPLAPVMNTPSYLGDGKVAIEWSDGGVNVGSLELAVPDRNLEKDAQSGDDIVVAPSHPRGSHRDCEGQRECGKITTEYSSSSSGASEGAERDETLGSVVDKVSTTLRGVQKAGMGASSSFTGNAGSGKGTGGSASLPQIGRAATFPVHKHVLQRSCLHGDASRTSKSQHSPGRSDGGHGDEGTIAAAGGGGHSGMPGVLVNGLGAGGEGWVTVHEAPVGSPTVFVDSGLLPARTYVYRLQAWNLIGHSEPAVGRVTTPSSRSRLSKVWRLISPWLSTGNSSAASEPDGGADVPAEGNEAAISGGDGQDSTGFGWTVWLDRVWVTLCWIWWGFTGTLKVIQAVLVLAGVSANLMRLRAAYGSEGTGAMVRRNWPIRLLWNISDAITRSRIFSRAVDIINAQLDHALGPSNVRRDIPGPQINTSSTARGNLPTSDVPRQQLRLYRKDETIGARSEVTGGYGHVQYSKSSYEACQQGGRRPWAGLSMIEEEAYASSGTAGGVPGNGGRERSARPVQRRTNSAGERNINRQSPRLLVQSFGDRIGPNGLTVPLPERPGVLPQRPLPSSSPPGALEMGGGYVKQRTQTFAGFYGDQADGSATIGEDGRHQRQHQRPMQRQQQRDPQQQDRPLEASDRNPSYSPASLVGIGNEDRSDDDGMVVEIRCKHRRRWWLGWGHAKHENESSSNAIGSERGDNGDAGAGEAYVPFRGHEPPQYGGIGFGAGGESYANDSTSAPGLVTSTGRDGNWSGDGVGSGFGFFAEGGRPVLEREGSGSSNLSMDFRRPMFHRRSSLSRLALGLKKGEAAGREGWQQEAQFAGACFSCQKKFKALKRQRHHCSRCQRVFCSKHGFTSHSAVTVCGIPGECICDVCISSASSGSRSIGSTDGIGDSVFDSTDTARASDRDPVCVLDRGRVVSDVGSIGSSVNAGSMRSSASSRSTRRFGWASPSSLRQLRSTSQPKPGATAADEEPGSTLIVTSTRTSTAENNYGAGAVSVTASPSDGSPAVDARRRDYSHDEQSIGGGTDTSYDDGVEAVGLGRSFFGLRRRIAR